MFYRKSFSANLTLLNTRNPAGGEATTNMQICRGKGLLGAHPSSPIGRDGSHDAETLDLLSHRRPRILDWGAIPFSNPGLPHCGRILYQLSHKGSPRILEWVA